MATKENHDNPEIDHGANHRERTERGNITQAMPIPDPSRNGPAAQPQYRRERNASDGKVEH